MKIYIARVDWQKQANQALEFFEIIEVLAWIN